MEEITKLELTGEDLQELTMEELVDVKIDLEELLLKMDEEKDTEDDKG